MFTAGDVVTARGDWWVIEGITAFADCTLLRLAGAGAANAQRISTLLHPFDRPVGGARAARICAVSKRRWARGFEARLSQVRRFSELRAAGPARIDVLPFQLEPALALIRGRSSRFLLADEVGLGKTIQAGLMLAELQSRGWCERALILTPAGLRRQWADELRNRFSIRPTVFDSVSLQAMTATLPFDVNPWSVEPVVIASIDFVKQAEVLRALTSQTWDIVIIDEAHQVATAALRSAAASRLAERARHVVLVTATPHGGDDDAFRSLCSLGQVDDADPILLFRRTREQVGLKRSRRVHLLPVRLTAAELEMHRLLAAYVRRLWSLARTNGNADVQLVAMVLGKRAFSSAASLAISIDRRLQSLARPVDSPVQSGLPFADDIDSSDEDCTVAGPAFDRCDEEEAALRRILTAARLASERESKMRALRRLLRRVHEPVIVFTEYRDTLAAVELAVKGSRRTAVLHGGLTPADRRASLEAFNGGAADLLLATDAGSEGLNLQARCRVVVNLELPWNPIRLEQRIGRVDRLGQSRTVHAIHLFAQETAESSVLASLSKRVQRIRASEVDIAASVIDGHEIDGRDPEPAIESGKGVGCLFRRHPAEKGTRPLFNATTDMTAPAVVEAERLTAFKAAAAVALPGAPRNVIPVTLLDSRKVRIASSPASSTVWLVQIGIVSGAGRLIDEILLAVSTPTFSIPPRKRRHVRAYAETLVELAGPAVIQFALRAVAPRVAEVRTQSVEWTKRALARERHLLEMTVPAASLVQPGLFDSRTTKRRADAGRKRGALAAESESRSSALEAEGIAAVRTPRLVALLISC